MRSIYFSLLIIISITGWVIGLGNNSVLGNILIHAASIGYLIGLLFWAKSKRGDDSNVAFRKKYDPGIIRGFRRFIKFGIALYLIVLAPIIIWSNWWPYKFAQPEHDWPSIQQVAVKRLNLTSHPGDSLNLDVYRTTWNDSITSKHFKVSGKQGQGTLKITVNQNDSIVNLEFKVK